jgi:hypothetical protein
MCRFDWLLDMPKVKQSPSKYIGSLSYLKQIIDGHVIQRFYVKLVQGGCSKKFLTILTPKPTYKVKRCKSFFFNQIC